MYGLLSSWLTKKLFATKIHKSETIAKITGLLKRFKNYNNIKMTCLYLVILEKIVPASKVFEGERLLPFEVKASIQTKLADLTDYLDDDYDNIDSHIQQYFSKSNSKIISGYIFESHYNSPQDNRNWRTASLLKLSSL